MFRSDESKVLEKALGLPVTRKASYFERISFGTPKKDPFEGKVDGNVWRVQGNKLFRKKSKKVE